MYAPAAININIPKIIPRNGPAIPAKAPTPPLHEGKLKLKALPRKNNNANTP